MHAPGHLGAAMLLAAPAWAVLDRRAAAAFVALALSTATLPDLDLYLPLVHHHGITHTLVFAWSAGAVLGVGLAAVADRADADVRERFPDGSLPRRHGYAFASAALAFGATTHVVTDMLSAPDVAQRVEALWPVAEQVVHLDVLAVHSTLQNLGLLAAGVVVQALAYAAFGRE